VEFHLPLRLSLEADALYRSQRATLTWLGFYGSESTTPHVYSSNRNTKAWDFPLLLKYRPLNGSMRPLPERGLRVEPGIHQFTVAVHLPRGCRGMLPAGREARVALRRVGAPSPGPSGGGRYRLQDPARRHLT